MSLHTHTHTYIYTYIYIHRDSEESLDTYKGRVEVADAAKHAAEARAVMLERDAEDVYAKLKRASEQLEETKNEHMALLTRHQHETAETRAEHADQVERLRMSGERMLQDLKHEHVQEQSTLKAALTMAAEKKASEHESAYTRRLDEAQRQMQSNCNELEQKHAMDLQAQRSNYEIQSAKAKTSATDALRDVGFLLKGTQQGRAYLYIHIYMYMCVCLCARTCSFIHSSLWCIPTHTHTHTHIQTRSALVMAWNKT
jgi:hypothetical protein